MATTTVGFSQWLAQALVPEKRLGPDQLGLLRAVFHFRHQQGDDYYATRLLSHFLLHCQSGLKVAQVARLLGISRPTASRQQHLTAKQTIQQAHHRLDGRPYGKLLPRYAGPLAQFLFAHPDASRHDVLDFLQQTFAIRVSTVALHKFLKKYGLDPASRRAATPTPLPASLPPVPPPCAPPPPLPALVLAQGQPVPTPAPPFSPHGRSMPAPSC